MVMVRFNERKIIVGKWIHVDLVFQVVRLKDRCGLYTKNRMHLQGRGLLFRFQRFNGKRKSEGLWLCLLLLA